jgi:hypothetical protein
LQTVAEVVLHGSKLSGCRDCAHFVSCSGTTNRQIAR